MKWLIVVLILAIVLIAGCTQQNISTTNNLNQIYSGNTSGLLPTRSEINTEYKITVTKVIGKDNISGYYSDYQLKGLNTTGFEEGSYKEAQIIEGMTVTIGEITIFKFDSVDNANSFYNSLITFVKNGGGYKEKSDFSVNADCFAIDEGNYAIGYSQQFFCKKSNVYFSTLIGSFIQSRLSDSENWAQTIANKI
jgi:hypothetical protein